MNLNKLHILLLIEKHQKVTEVANVLGISQPTVTFHMKSLEQELKIPLFQTRSGKILLTEAGRTVSHYAQRIMTLVEQTHRINRDYLSLRTGSLAIGASFIPAAYTLPVVLRSFTANYPDTHLTLTVKPAPSILQLLVNEQLDIGFISSLQAPSDFIQYIPLREDHLVIVFHPQHPLAHWNPLQPDKLKDACFISHGKDSTTYQMVAEWMNRQGIILNHHLEIDSLEIIKRLLIQGYGFSIISHLAVEQEINQGLLVSRTLPGEPLKRHIYLAFHKEHWQSPLMREFIRTFQIEAGSW
jgi:DNA-binding transcriptional LysR family regulator